MHCVGSIAPPERICPVVSSSNHFSRRNEGSVAFRANVATVRGWHFGIHEESDLPVLGAIRRRLRTSQTLCGFFLLILVTLGALAPYPTSSTASATAGVPSAEAVDRAAALEATLGAQIGPNLRSALVDLEDFVLLVEQEVHLDRSRLTALDGRVEEAEQNAAILETALDNIDRLADGSEKLTESDVALRNQRPVVEAQLEGVIASTETGERLIATEEAVLDAGFDRLLAAQLVRAEILVELRAELAELDAVSILVDDVRLADKVVFDISLGRATIAQVDDPGVALVPDRLVGEPPSASVEMVWPTIGAVNSGFGMRWHPVYGGQRMHTGVDIDGDWGEDVVAVEAGVVTRSDWNGGYGKTVIIDHGNGISSLYSHLSEQFVEVGDEVEKGAVVGLVGATGTATDAHLHFEVRLEDEAVDPFIFLP